MKKIIKKHISPHPQGLLVTYNKSYSFPKSSKSSSLLSSYFLFLLFLESLVVAFDIATN